MQAKPDAFLILIQRLDSLQDSLAPAAGPQMAAARRALVEAAQARERAEMGQALRLIGRAMEQLAAACELAGAGFAHEIERILGELLN